MVFLLPIKVKKDFLGRHKEPLFVWLHRLSLCLLFFYLKILSNYRRISRPPILLKNLFFLLHFYPLPLTKNQTFYSQ